MGGSAIVMGDYGITVLAILMGDYGIYWVSGRGCCGVECRHAMVEHVGLWAVNGVLGHEGLNPKIETRTSGVLWVCKGLDSGFRIYVFGVYYILACSCFIRIVESKMVMGTIFN